MLFGNDLGVSKQQYFSSFMFLMIYIPLQGASDGYCFAFFLFFQVMFFFIDAL